MMYQDDDELDRAIFALPLEPLPAGLRASIMAAVTAAPGPVLSRWETFGIGAILALGAWLVLLFAHGNWDIGRTLGPLALALGRALIVPDTLRWVGFGIAAALIVSLVSIPQRFTSRGRLTAPR
jgi:hypothetical protein